MEMSIAVMTSSTALTNVLASNVPSSLRNFRRFSDARLHELLSRLMYSEHGLDALIRPVSGLVCQSLMVSSYWMPGSAHSHAALVTLRKSSLASTELFRKVTKAAWECADPGIQYDDTINDWHTNPETGRINASNPCSEYMSLDNSSCNLASLNLLKFLKIDGTFDSRNFVKAVELVITAMDISICFADFPTEPIGETTRAYRQLGIGYANLGALLMATGHAYDSRGGQTLAAAITSLMTGTAYRRSAELAGTVGAYDGFARNADAHARVMRKHAAANDAIRPVGADDADVLKAATAQWQECLA